MIFYPPELPQYLHRPRFQKSAADGRLRVQMGSGHFKVRRLTALPVIRLTTETPPYSTWQLARFWRFWNDDLSGGVLPFTIRDQQTDGVVLLDDYGDPMLDDDYEPLLNTAFWLALFGDETPGETPLGGGYWIVSFGLELLP